MGPNVLLKLQQSLTGRYQLDRELGHGGMATVYLATDLKHQRTVALKVLHSDPAHALGVERFTREVTTAARLAHPHILPLLDSGNDDGLLWYSMPFVEGGSLRERLTREGQLPVDDAVRIAAEIADALASAHEQGVIHRDIKPENILLSGGYALLADFGIAKAAQGTGEALTHTGFALGTPAYMSPEQASADRELDPRADIYSLGCVLYEMLAGRPPYLGTSTQAIIVKLFTESIPPLGTMRASIPAWLEDAVTTSVAKNPEDRFSTAAEFAGRLRQRPAEPAPSAPRVEARGRTVGRDRELATMRRAFDTAAGGQGRLLTVSGEPGIGKTALVEDFLTGVIRSTGCIIARGRCSERLAGTEAYLPLLEALQSLVETPSRSWLASAMKRLAPSWYAEVASGETPTGETSLLQAVSQERMKRELVGFIQEVVRQQPLVLFLDDVHWADASTVDMLAYLGTRLDGLRLLIVATHRPAELALTGHPFRALKMHLMTRQLCEELALGFLDRDGIDALIATQFPRHGFPATLTSLILGKTEGNPLFVVEVLRQLRHRNAVVESADQWELAGSLDDLGGEIPSSIKSMIERSIDQIDAEDRKLLAAASLGGERFDTAILADVLEISPVSVEERVERLEKGHGLVHRLGDGELPDGTPTVRYGFVHALYHEAFLHSLTLSRRVALSGATAAAIEHRHDAHASDVAGVLALLFESARNWERAVHYFVVAARHASHTFAHFELETLCRRGRALLKHLPEGAGRDQADLELSTSLGRCLTILRGFAAPEVEQLYSHARELCERLIEPRQQITALVGLWEYYEVRGNLATARALAREILALAEKAGDDGLLVKSYDVLADTLHYAGEFADSVDFAERGIRLYDPARHRGLAQEFGSYDPGVACRSEGALALWLLGQEERARQMSEEGYALARRLNHPFSIAMALAYAAWLDVYRRDPASVGRRANELGALCLENGFAFFHAESIVLQGWAEARTSDPAAGVAQIRRGIQEYRSTGALLDMPLWCGLLADALEATGETEACREAVREGLAIVEQTGVKFWESELQRIRERVGA